MARSFIDFAALKEHASFSATIDALDLTLKQAGNQWRGPCPACRQGGDRALVVTEGKGYFCFSAKKGGDQIALAAHILDLPARDAAQELAERTGMVQSPPRNSTGKGTSTRTVSEPESEGEGGEGSKLSPLSYLEPDHEAVVALGLDPKFCEANGIGYAPRGVVRGSVAIPFRDEDGTLLGYLGVQDLTFVPPDFQSNVTPFRKRA